MKIINASILVLSLILAAPAWSANSVKNSKPAHSTKKTTTSTPSETSLQVTPVSSETYSSGSSTSSSGGGFEHFGVGLKTASALTFTTASLSAMLELSDNLTAEVLAGVESTSPFTFGVGGLFKATVEGNRNTGFHIGGGVGVGSSRSPKTATQAFSFAFGGLAGVHATVPGMEKLLFSLDGGAYLRVVDGETNFNLGGLSPALGFGVTYRFQ